VNRRRRFLSAGVVVLLLAATTAFLGATASAATKYTFVFLTQPATDAVAGDTITGSRFNGGSDATFIQVQLQDGSGNVVTNSNTSVTFSLASAPGLATGKLSVTPQPLVNGVATFGVGTLSIATPNEPQFTDYKLVPFSAKGPSITGAPSNGFDVWETACLGECSVNIRNGNDVYTSNSSGVFLSASQLPKSAVNISCEGQKLIFSDSVFVSENGTMDNKTKLVSHVTRADMKAAANNGQAHVQWCIGLPDEGDWTASGATPVHEGNLWVALAPPCPNVPNPEAFAPCIVRQYGDGNGGNFTEGFLPGDPPRRT
jgi:hypothetical protein